MNRFQKHLLTTTKKFIYVSDSEKGKPIKRSKALSKFFRTSTNDFIYVCENAYNIYFSDASTQLQIII